jgi:SAM-dependent methyltransferase
MIVTEPQIGLDGSSPQMSDTVPSSFTEAEYLAANPDVARAVADGHIASGRLHYERYGIFENRALQPGIRAAPLLFPVPPGYRPQRRDKILANLDLRCLCGMEIGALTSPLVNRREGNIFYVDRADTEMLKTWYKGHDRIDPERIVDVDGIWGDRSLRDCVGPDRNFDYAVASHVIEHIPDVVTWLQEIEQVLRPGGSLRLAIPDKRYNFDILRAETRLHDLLAAFVERLRRPSARMIIEHHSLIRDVDRRQAWREPLNLDSLQPYTTIGMAVSLARDAVANQKYHDVHCWVFTPLSFAVLFHALAMTGLIAFACEFLVDTAPETDEFFVGLRLTEDPPADRAASWLPAVAELRTAAEARERPTHPA